MNKISHSSIRIYTECPRKYKLWYKNRYRPKNIHGALLVGSSVDNGLNSLLENRDLNEAIKVFDKSFRFQNINNIPTYLPKSTNIVYSKRDFDAELLKKDDFDEYYKFKNEIEYNPDTSLEQDIEKFQKAKENKGFDNLTHKEKQLYNMINWLSIRRKGHIMIRDYHKIVLPKIKGVVSVQKRGKIENNNGDTLSYILDLVVDWEDGKRYLIDNKTSALEYEKDSAMKSQQLILYYHAEKEEMGLNAVGFIVMYKNILKNRKKICKSCNKDGSGQRHKTCDNLIDNKRCNGEWLEEINPECKIDIILNDVPEATENLVIQTFDEANEGIKKESFGPNLNACGNENFKCAFYNYCWHGKKDDIIELGKENTNESTNMLNK